jgi:hypothetical protein
MGKNKTRHKMSTDVTTIDAPASATVTTAQASTPNLAVVTTIPVASTSNDDKKSADNASDSNGQRNTTGDAKAATATGAIATAPRAHVNPNSQTRTAAPPSNGPVATAPKGQKRPHRDLSGPPKPAGNGHAPNGSTTHRHSTRVVKKPRIEAKHETARDVHRRPGPGAGGHISASDTDSGSDSEPESDDGRGHDDDAKLDDVEPDDDGDEADEVGEAKIVPHTNFAHSLQRKFADCAVIESKLKRRTDGGKEEKKRKTQLMGEIRTKMEEINKDARVPVAVRVDKSRARFELVQKPGAMNPVTQTYVADYLKRYFIESRRKISSKDDIDMIARDMFSREARGTKESKPQLKIIMD